MASKNKIIEMIGSIKTIYPYYAKDANVEILVSTWTALLGEYPDNIIEAAFFKALQSCKMPPTPADIIEKIDAMNAVNEASDEELWAEFTKALRNTGAEVYYLQYPKFGVDHRKNIQKIWDQLPEKIKLYLGSKGELMRMSTSYTDDELKFEKNRFLKAMPELKTKVEYIAIAQKNNLMIEEGEKK